MTPRVVGFVGLGHMGRPMAERIVAAGFPLVGFDAAGTAERLPDGADGGAGVEDVAARADTLLLSLPDGAVVLDVVDAVAAAEDRRATTVVDLSTTGPAAAVEAATRLAAVGVTYVDGPVSGGVAGARRGTLALMYAGPAAVLEDHRGVLEAFAGHVVAVGTVAGQGQTMKLLNNFLSATALAATSEALTFGLAHGLSLPVMLDVLNASTGRNSATVDKFPNRVLTGTYDAGLQHRAHGEGPAALRRLAGAGEHARRRGPCRVRGLAAGRRGPARQRLHRDLALRQRDLTGEWERRACAEGPRRAVAQPPDPDRRPDVPVAPAAAGSCCDRRHRLGGYLTSPAGRTARGRCCRGRGTRARSRSRRP